MGAKNLPCLKLRLKNYFPKKCFRNFGFDLQTLDALQKLDFEHSFQWKQDS